jgi:hypothetical protein
MLRIATALAMLLLAAPALGRATNSTSEEGGDFASLQGGESLRGGSTVLATAGFAAVGVAYGQGLTLRDDLGLSAEVTWSSGELVLGGFWRRQLGRPGGWDLAGRLALGWYLDGGARLIYDDNLSDRGLQLTPGLALSSRGLGLFSVAFDLPLTITTWRGGGTWIAPRVAVSYEVALYDQVALGLRGSLAWRGGTGGAPRRAGQVLPELLVTATWKIF